MELWLNWLIGFFIWCLLIVMLSLFTWLITSLKSAKGKGLLRNDLFNYHHTSPILPEKGFFLDTHSHTLASDGIMTPEQNILWHIANGFHAFVLTDHNTGKNNAEILGLQAKYPQILIIPGFEYTTYPIHLNFIGIMDFPEKVKQKPTHDEIRQAIAKAKQLGAIVQADHISWTKNEPLHRSGEVTHPTRDELLAWGVDTFEINNEMRWYDPYTLHWFERLKEQKRLPRPISMTTGTDIHSPLKEWCSCWTELLLTEEERKKPTWETVKTALLEGRTKIWVDHDYLHPPEAVQIGFDPDKNAFKSIFAPFFALRYGVEKIPGLKWGIFSYILWFALLYFPLRALICWLISL